VSTSVYNIERQPEIAIRPPKPVEVIPPELQQIASKFQRQVRDFRWCPPWKKISQMISQMIATMIDYQKLHDWRAKRLYWHFRLSVVVAIARIKLLRGGRGRNPLICRWNCHRICHSSGYISISGFEGHIAISGCRPLSQSLGDTLFGLAIVENTGLAVGSSTLPVVVSVV